ncbi:unnamed protein product [Nezara viridula]|uniref:Dynein light chain n=1 Tax=Nezara viridula TaxID=85310 RepID=A0A9P0EBM1_NEZVI|nr:unnamed protein product [Nezara viridula]
MMFWNHTESCTEVDEECFPIKEVANIIKESVDSIIGARRYSYSKVSQWTEEIIKSCINRLTKSKEGYKFVVTCSIIQRGSSALYSSAQCYWDQSTDCCCTIRWENANLYCLTAVYAIAIQ